MIFRITVFSKMKDRARDEINKYFDTFTAQEIDVYDKGVKGMAYIFEVSLNEEAVPNVKKVIEEIKKQTGAKVISTLIETKEV